MKNVDKTVKVILAIPAVFFGLFFISDFFVGKTLGVLSFALELFFTLLDLYILAIPFVLVFIIKNSRGRVLFLLIGLFYTFILFVVQKSPQMETARFYHHSKNIALLESLKTEDVSYITFGEVKLIQSEQIRPIVEALNESTWYSPNHERRGKEVSMKISLQNGQEMNFQVSRFYDEDSAALLFTRSRDAGSWADGNAYVPKLPSLLENLGYRLPSDE